MNNIIGVEGTIPIEFTYYLIILAIFFFLKKYNKLIYVVLLISFAISCFSYTLFNSFYNPNAKWISHNLSLEKYCFTFIVGIVVYIIWKNKKIIVFNEFSLVAHIILLGFCIYCELPNQEIYLSVWISVLIIILSSKNWLSIFLFENPIIEYIGKISYSIYLIHLPVIHNIRLFDQAFYNFLVWFIATIALSSLTYYFIEQKFVNLAKKKYKYNNYKND